MRNVHFRFLFVAKKHRLLKLSILSQWNANRREMTIFIEHANISITRQQNSRLKYLKPKLVVVYKDKRFVKESLLDVGKHFLATATFQCTHFCSYHPPCVKKKRGRRGKTIEIKLFEVILGREDQSSRETPSKERSLYKKYFQK